MPYQAYPFVVFCKERNSIARAFDSKEIGLNAVHKAYRFWRKNLLPLKTTLIELHDSKIGEIHHS